MALIRFFDFSKCSGRSAQGVTGNPNPFPFFVMVFSRTVLKVGLNAGELFLSCVFYGRSWRGGFVGLKRKL